MDEARALAEKAAINEYRRLLYVAMTRAAERLVVCGAKGPNKIPDGCWYATGRGGAAQGLRRRTGRRRQRRGAALSQGRGAGGEDQGRSRAARNKFRCRPGSRATPQPTFRRCAALSGRRARSMKSARPRAAAGVKAALLRGVAHPPPAAVAARHCARAARQGDATTFSPSADRSSAGGGAQGDRRQGDRPARRRPLCRAVCSGQPRRSADRRQGANPAAKATACPARSTGSPSPRTRF